MGVKAYPALFSNLVTQIRGCTVPAICKAGGNYRVINHNITLNKILSPNSCDYGITLTQYVADNICGTEI